MSWSATHDGWSPAARTGWRPLEIAAMVAGFVFFWPVGLAILGYLVFRNGGFKRGCRRADRRDERFAAFGRGSFGSGWGGGELRRDSGNSAFEDYKDEELKRRQAEFDRLVEEQRAFGEFLESLRRAKDKAEFDQFLASRRTAGPTGPAHV